jgi:hypothetical protein
MVDASSALTALVDYLEQKALPITTTLDNTLTKDGQSRERRELGVSMLGNNYQWVPGEINIGNALRPVLFLEPLDRVASS